MKSIAKVLVPAALVLSSFAAVAAPTGAGSAFRDDPFSTLDRYEISGAATTAPQAQATGAFRRDDPFGGFNDVAETPRSAAQPAAMALPVNRDDPFAGFNDFSAAPAKSAPKATTQRVVQPRSAGWYDPYAS